MKWVTLIGYPCIRYSDKNSKYFFKKVTFYFQLKTNISLCKIFVAFTFQNERRTIFSKETANAHLLEAGLG